MAEHSMSNMLPHVIFQYVVHYPSRMGPMSTSKLISRKASNLSLTRTDSINTFFFTDRVNSIAKKFILHSTSKQMHAQVQQLRR